MLRGVYQGKEIESEGSDIICRRLCYRYFVTFHEAEYSVLKGKCYRSMSNSEKPDEMKMTLEFSDLGQVVHFFQEWILFDQTLWNDIPDLPRFVV